MAIRGLSDHCALIDLKKKNGKKMKNGKITERFLSRVPSKTFPFFKNITVMEWDIPCIARVTVRISFPGGGSKVSQQAGWNDF